MNNNNQHIKFEERIRKELDFELSTIDPQVERRLRECRMKAVESLNEHRQGWLRMPRFAVATSLASLIILIAASILFLNLTDRVTTKTDELEVLAIVPAIDMYKDLEMLQWMAADDKK